MLVHRSIALALHALAFIALGCSSGSDEPSWPTTSAGSGTPVTAPSGTAQSSQPAHSPTTPADPNASKTDVCKVVGGAGAQLSQEVVLRIQCDANCAIAQATHPNLTCTWGALDVTPTAACAIVGGAGVPLAKDTSARGRCAKECETNAVTHPNLSCTWGKVDITPIGACSIVGGAGAQLATATESRGDCFSRCVDLRAAHPNEVCRWNGARIN